MNIYAILALVFATLTSAQTAEFAELPDCAKTCATGSLPPECHLDPKCICSKASFISDISCCVAKNCPASAVQKSLQVAQQLCSTVKVTLPNPQPDSCAGGALAGGSSSAPASSSSAPASSGVNTAASSTGSPASTSSGPTSTAGAAASPAATTSAAASCVRAAHDLKALGALAIAALLL